MDNSEKDQKTFDKAKYIKNVRAKEAQINFRKNFEVDGEEISKNIQLSTKYRDRAQERKIGQIDANDDSEGEYGYLENEEERDLNNEVNVAKQFGLDFADENDRYQLQDNVVRLKGLDYSLLKKELDKNDAVKKQEKDKIIKIKAAKTLESIKESLMKAKKEPSDFAKRVMGVFDKRYVRGDKNVQSKEVVFPIPYSYYEYEIKSTSFINDLPTIVLKDKNDDDQFSVIPTIGEHAMQGLTTIITIYNEKGKKGLKEERERLERLKQEELKQMEIEGDHDIFDDVNEDLFEKNVKQSEEVLKQEKELKEKDQENSGDDNVFKNVKDYRELVIEEQKKEFLKQKLENIINPNNNNESLKMGTRLNEKRKNPFEKDEIDYYDECFPKVAPNMTQMKELREREKIFGQAEAGNTNTKKKDKDKFGRRLAAVERIIKEKQDLSNKQ